jgi:DNA-binding CsgD family transcriptional regulator/5-methylcytosine-specific restriction endonuclease McrA
VSSIREAIAALHESGVSQPEIARQLDLAPTTVSYHIERLDGHLETGPVGQDQPLDAVLSGPETRAAVARMLSEGMSRAEIARRLGLAKPTITYHARRLNQKINENCARRFDWDAVQRYYDEGHSVRQCIKVFGFSSSSWFDAGKRGAIVSRPSATPMSELLVAGTYRGRYNVKARLIKEGLKKNRCERCGISEWRGAALTLALHHVNGQRNDNRLENLELLCPNCHSQTSTYAGRNGGRGKTLD